LYRLTFNYFVVDEFVAAYFPPNSLGVMNIIPLQGKWGSLEKLMGLKPGSNPEGLILITPKEFGGLKGSPKPTTLKGLNCFYYLV
jgi:hypothetical protein